MKLLQDTKMNNYYGAVYKIECLINNKVYIGQSKNPEYRWKYNHLYELKLNKHRNRYLQQDFNLYGSDNFKFSILLYCKTKEESLIQETNYINSYGGINSTRTYNMLDRFTENDEMKKMISDLQKGKPPHNKCKPRSEHAKQKYRDYLNNLSEEDKNIISQKKKNTFKQHPEKTWLGRHHTLETRQKLSENGKNYVGENNGHFGHYKYTIEQIQKMYDLYKIFNNYSEVGRQLHLTVTV